MEKDEVVGLFGPDGDEPGRPSALQELFAPPTADDVVVVPLDDVRWEVVRLAAALFVGDESTQTDALDRLGDLLGISENEIIAAAGRLRPGSFA